MAQRIGEFFGAYQAFMNRAIAGHQRVVFGRLRVGRGPANIAIGRLERDDKINRRFDHRPVGGGIIKVVMQAIMVPNGGGDIGDEIGVADFMSVLDTLHGELVQFLINRHGAAQLPPP